MTIDGLSIRAARSLARLNQTELARRARVSTAAISRFERSGPVRGNYATISRVIEALESAGIEITDHGVYRGAR
jgi:predicted transcriptional regulator